MAKVKVQLIEGQYFDRAEEKSRTFEELMDRFEREHLVKLASRQTGQVFVKRFRAFFGDRTLAEITPKLIVDYKSQTLRHWGESRLDQSRAHLFEKGLQPC